MFGRTTLTSRVEAWECDFNGHWNTRFYARAFQEAAERAAILAGEENPGVTALGARHLRFLRELFSGAPVEVSTAVVVGGAFDGALVHFLTSEGRLAATAIDRPGVASRALPRIDAVELDASLPRGLGAFDPGSWKLDTVSLPATELGIVRPSDLDHRGAMLFDDLVRRAAYAAHEKVVGMGISPQFMEETGIGRMLVEMRVTFASHPRAGVALCATSTLLSLGRRHIESAYCISSSGGEAVALVELYMLAVDLRQRKVVDFPDAFLARNMDSGFA